MTQKKPGHKCHVRAGALARLTTMATMVAVPIADPAQMRRLIEYDDE